MASSMIGWCNFIKNKTSNNVATIIAVVIIWILLRVYRAVWRFTAVPDIRKLLIGSFLAIPLAVIFLFYLEFYNPL